MNRGKAVVRFKVIENCEAVLVSRFLFLLQCKVNLAVISYKFDKTRFRLAKTKAFMHLIFVQQTPMAVIDNGPKPQIRSVCDNEIDRLAWFEVGRRFFIQEFVDFGRGGNSAISAI